MKIIHNSIIPPKGFKSINLFGILFVRKNAQLAFKDINHEVIHTAQMKELLYVFFYIVYFFEWLLRVLFTKDCFSHSAYKNISFEVEAYENQLKIDYINNRKHFAQWKNRESDTNN